MCAHPGGGESGSEEEGVACACQLSLWHVTAEPGDVDGACVVISANLQHLSG